MLIAEVPVVCAPGAFTSAEGKSPGPCTLGHRDQRGNLHKQKRRHRSPRCIDASMHRGERPKLNQQLRKHASIITSSTAIISRFQYQNPPKSGHTKNCRPQAFSSLQIHKNAVTTGVSPGIHLITAQYEGNGFYGSSTSSALTQTVIPGGLQPFIYLMLDD